MFTSPDPLAAEIFPLVAVEGYEYEEHGRESPKGGASVAYERKRNADYWHQAYGHAYIYEQVHEYAACNAISVYSCKRLPAVFRASYDSPYHEYIKKYYSGRTDKTPFLSDCTENEVSALLGNKAVSGLCAVQITFSGESSSVMLSR